MVDIFDLGPSHVWQYVNARMRLDDIHLDFFHSRPRRKPSSSLPQQIVLHHHTFSTSRKHDTNLQPFDVVHSRSRKSCIFRYTCTATYNRQGDFCPARLARHERVACRAKFSLGPNELGIHPRLERHVLPQCQCCSHIFV